EADQLADSIVVIDRGRAVATGTPSELKSRIGGDLLDVTLADPAQGAAAAAALAEMTGKSPAESAGQVSLQVGSGGQSIAEAVRILDERAIGIADIALRRPSLDEVFLRLTGHTTNSGTT